MGVVSYELETLHGFRKALSELRFDIGDYYRAFEAGDLFCPHEQCGGPRRVRFTIHPLGPEATNRVNWPGELAELA